MKIQSEIEKYYNKFNEDKRLRSRHGQVEYRTTMKYIHEYLDDISGRLIGRETDVAQPDNDVTNFGDAMRRRIKILDIGAGTGAYSIPLAEEGYSVTAVELVKYNLGILKQKSSLVEAYQGNAMKLSRFPDESFDMTLLFGPMYHLFTEEDQLKALNEAKRVTKRDGIILVAYVMNEYAVITYAFKEGHIKECLEKGMLTDDYRTVSDDKDLYHYVRTEDIEALDRKAGLKRLKIISADGPSDYIRPVLNGMDDETFEEFVRYHLATCERQDTIGASSHTVDILQRVE
jgi:ubiquinone/menaquinone biosynthesis C-methylase UbiE